MTSSLRFLFTGVALIFSSQAIAGSNLTLILGAPNQELSAISSSIDSIKTIGDGPYEVGFSTEITSLIFLRQFSPSHILSALKPDGSISRDLLFRAIALAANQSPLVLNLFGSEIPDATCNQMKAHPQTVFIFPAGVGGSQMDGENNHPCASANIIRVAPLNSEGTDLLPGSNFGQSVHLGAPGSRIPVIDRHGNFKYRSDGFVAATIVALSLSQYIQERSHLHNVTESISNFFNDQTTTNPQLSSKIRDGRILR